MLLAAIGGGILIGRATVEEPGPPPRALGLAQARGLASDEVARMLEGRIAAMNSGDGQAVAAFCAEVAVLEERDQDPAVVTEGREQIASHLQTYLDAGSKLESGGFRTSKSWGTSSFGLTTGAKEAPRDS